MNALDWTLLAVIGASVLLGLIRGFMRETISLAGWVAGIWLALRFAATLSASLPLAHEWPLARTAAVAVVIVVLCVFSAALAGWFIRELIRAARLSAADRTLGGVFGFARGLLIIGLAIFLVRGTALYDEPLWRQSLVLPPIEAALAFALRQFPELALRGPRA